MEEIVVTRLWMAGVVAMMLVFAVVALIGHFRQKNRDEATADRRADEG